MKVVLRKGDEYIQVFRYTSKDQGKNKEIRHFECNLYCTSDTTQLFQKMYFHV